MKYLKTFESISKDDLMGANIMVMSIYNNITELLNQNNFKSNQATAFLYQKDDDEEYFYDFMRIKKNSVNFNSKLKEENRNGVRLMYQNINEFFVELEFRKIRSKGVKYKYQNILKNNFTKRYKRFQKEIEDIKDHVKRTKKLEEVFTKINNSNIRGIKKIKLIGDFNRKFKSNDYGEEMDLTVTIDLAQIFDVEKFMKIINT